MSRMLNAWFTAAAAVTMAAMSTVPVAAQLAKGEKDTVIFAPVKVVDSVASAAEKQTPPQTLALNRLRDSIQSQFYSALSATRVFQILERERLKELGAEEDLAKVLVNPNDKNALAALQGKTGAKFIFLPEITGFQNQAERADMQTTGETDVHLYLYVAMQARIVDIATGKLLPDVPSERLTWEDTLQATSIERVKVRREEMYDENAERISRTLCYKLVSNLRPAKVLTVTGSQAMVNRGAELGFVPGMVVEFYATQEIKDDDTGEVFSNEVPMGRGQILRGDGRQCFVTLMGENVGVAKGCVVKIIGAADPAGQPASAGPQAGPAPAGQPMAAQPSAPPPGPAVNPGSGEAPLDFNAVVAPLPDDPAAIANVKFTQQKVQKAISVLGVNQGKINDLLKVNVHLAARQELKARYKLVWYTATGMEIEPGKAPWTTLFFAGKQNITVQGLSPNNSAASFQLFIEAAN